MLVVERFHVQPDNQNLRSARVALQQLAARAAMADAVVVPQHQAPGFEGVYVRELAEEAGKVAFVSETGGRLVVPLRSWKEVCYVETVPKTTLVPPGGGRLLVFGSQTRAALPPEREVWRDRRRDRLPFPDSNGDSEEEVSESPSGYEAALRHLPFDFGYLARVPRHGSRMLLAEHNEVLLQGFFRRTRQRLRREA
jgi:hypothetical protein